MARAAARARKTPTADELLPRFVATLDPDWIDEALAATGTSRGL